MERFLTLSNNLESLVAELIAVSPSDAGAVTAIAQRLGSFVEEFDTDSDGEVLIQQCRRSSPAWPPANCNSSPTTR